MDYNGAKSVKKDKEDDEFDQDQASNLRTWITVRLDSWRQTRDANELPRWEEYERIWRGIWDGADKMRESERSRIVSPAAQQALETHVSETSEAVFGPSKFFALEADPGVPPMAVEMVELQLNQDLKKDKFKKRVDDCLMNGGLFGTGIAEIVTEEVEEAVVTRQPIEGTGQDAYGVVPMKRMAVYPRPISPKHFIIDPNALDVDSALGCAVEEPISLHEIQAKMESGEYYECDIGESSYEIGKDASPRRVPNTKGFAYVTKYYGKVPLLFLLEAQGVKADKAAKQLGIDAEDVDELKGESSESYQELVEAIVIMVDDKVLKCTENMYMGHDRPIVAYQDDTVPGKFYGRGVMEKAYNMQKAIDAQLRSHLDSLALTTAPMMGMDASRLPRGMKFEVRPGKTLLTNGPPKEILHPFIFGSPTDANAQTAREFERMLLQATGTVDAAGMPGQVNGQTPAQGMSMALSALIKKNKRMLLNFQDCFFVPLLEKITLRYMQFEPERYPPMQYKFVPASTLGIMAREYEQQQFISLLQTLGPQSPIVPLILKNIVQHSSISNKETLAAELEKLSQPNPEQQKAAQANAEAQNQLLLAQVELVKAEGNKQNAIAQRESAQAAKYLQDARFKPEEVRAQMMAAMGRLANNYDEDQADFDKRIKAAQVINDTLKIEEMGKDRDSNEKITAMQLAASRENKMLELQAKQKATTRKVVRDDQGRVSGITSE